MLPKLKQFALALLLINSVASANDISQLDGDWYSFKWKYGYSLSNGKGVAFATNSPNFKVGQEIVRLTAVGKNSFVGENVYKDGKFYKVKATLDQDGKLLFEGEKNVKWEMEKIDPETYSSIVNSKPEKQANKKDAQPTARGGVRPEIFYRDLNNWEVGVCLGYISQEIKQKGRENIHKGHAKYFGKNIRFANRGSEIIKNFPECNGKSVDHIIQCLDSKGISPDEIALILGVNNGLANSDVSDRTKMSFACLDL
jgi:hypothetical protein